MRLEKAYIGGKWVKKFSMNNNLMGCEFYGQFEGEACEVVLPNDWLISIIGMYIKINGQDFVKL